jgi:RND family efflux transporter MFP subunit
MNRAPREGFNRELRLMLVFSVAALGFASCSSQGRVPDSAPIVPVTKATRSDLLQELVLTAEFIPYQDVDLMAKVAGYIRAIRVDIGDHVHQGELLATLEVPEMQNEMVKAAAASKAAQSDVITARNDLARAKAAYEIAHLSFTRIQDVSKKEPGLVPQQDVDVAHSHDLEADAQLSTAQSTLQSAEERAKEAMAQQELLKTMFQYTQITAPFAGVITKRYANTGSMIQAGISSQTQSMPVVRLAQDDLLRLILPVPVTAVPQIHVGQTVDVTVNTLGKTFPGKVTRFADSINTSTRTMDTEVDVPNPKRAIVPGMYAEVRLRLADRKAVLSLPLDAVEGLGTESQHAYQVDSEDVVHIIPVKVGIDTPTRVEIVSGVREGETFVVGRHTGITDGEKVRPRQADYDVDHGSNVQEK